MKWRKQVKEWIERKWTERNRARIGGLAEKDRYRKFIVLSRSEVFRLRRGFPITKDTYVLRLFDREIYNAFDENIILVTDGEMELLVKACPVKRPTYTILVK